MNYKILLTNQPIHNYYYLDFLKSKWRVLVHRVVFFRPKCKTLVRLEAPTSYRTYDTITVCDTTRSVNKLYRTCDACRTTAVLSRPAFMNTYQVCVGGGGRDRRACGRAHLPPVPARLSATTPLPPPAWRDSRGPARSRNTDGWATQ